MSPTKPTILIVPGSFSEYGIYNPFLAQIRAQGFTAFALKLPSTQKRYPLPPASLQDDAAHLRGVVEHLIAEAEAAEIVVLAHSYGGTVATEALEGLGVKDGKGVRRLVFLSAVAPRVGENQVSAMKLEENFIPEATDGYMHMDPVAMAPFVANDLPYAQAYEKVLQLPHHSAASFQSEVTKCSYKEIPLTYIFCERDMVISPEIQQRFIDTIEEISGNKVDVKKIDAGHVPMWSKLDETVRLLLEAALQ